MNSHSRHFIITGPPGTGKSSVIKVLANHGFECHYEVARQIIKENQDNNLDVFPWLNMRQFSDMVYDRMRHLYELKHHESCFYDRSVVDLIGYMNIAGEVAPDRYAELALEVGFNKKVFFLPAWEDIYTTDEQRKETYEEAVEIGDALHEAYSKLGFEVVDVPFHSVERRAAFILKEAGLEVHG